MTSDVTHEVLGLPRLPEGRGERLARRIAGLYANDPQFGAAEPTPRLSRRPAGPACGSRRSCRRCLMAIRTGPRWANGVREFVTDPATGRTSARLLTRFATITYRDVWARVRAIATAWRNDPDPPGATPATSSRSWVSPAPNT